MIEIQKIRGNFFLIDYGNTTKASVTKVIQGKYARMEVYCFTFDRNKDFLSSLASQSFF